MTISKRFTAVLLGAAFACSVLADLGFKLWVLVKHPFVGVSDYACYSTMGRNLLAGKGFYVDWVNFYFYPQPSLHHPEDTWPLLHAVWIALSYLVFGDNSFAARLPSLIFAACLSGLLYFHTRSLSNWRAAALAVMFLLTVPFYFYSSVWPSSDMAFAVMALGLLVLAFHAVHARSRRAGTWLAILAGVLAGLAAEQKIQAMVLLAVLPPWFLLGNRKLPSSWRWTMALVSVVLIWAGIAPLILRNYRTFGEPRFLQNATPYEAICMNGSSQFKMEEWAEKAYRRYDLHPELASEAVDRDPTRKLVDRLKKTVVEGVKLVKSVHKGRVIFPPLLILVPLGMFAARGYQFSFLKLTALMAAAWTTLLYISHYEARYQLPLVALGAIYAGIGMDEVMRRVCRGFGRPAWLVFLLAVMGAAYLATVRAEYGYVQSWNRNTEVWPLLEVQAKEGRPDMVVMAVNPMEVSYHLRVPTVSIPAGPWPDVRDALLRYRVTHLALRYDTRDPHDDIWHRRLLDPLNEGQKVPGFEEVYRRPWKDGRSGIVIFRVHPEDLPPDRVAGLSLNPDDPTQVEGPRK